MFFLTTIISLTSRCSRLESADRLTGWLVDLYCHSHCPSDSSLERSSPFSLSEIHTLNLKKKAKVKASAWKTIRKTRYNIYEDYFQVFRGFSKKSYPENLKNKKLIKNGSEIEYHRKCVRVGYGGKLQNIWVKSIFWTHTNLLTLQSVDEKIVLTCEHDEGGRSDVRHPSMTWSPTRNNQRRMEKWSAHESRQDVAR